MTKIKEILDGAENLMEEAEKQYQHGGSTFGVNQQVAHYCDATYKGIRALYEQNKVIIELLKKIAKVTW